MYISIAALVGGLFFITYCACSILYYSLFIDELLALGATVKAGAMHLVYFTREQYIDLLRLSAKATKFLYAIERREAVRTTHYRVNAMLESLSLDDSNGKLRKQPFMILLQGYPGSGKTTLAIDLAINLLKARYGCAYADEIVTLNETDQFQSEFRSSHKVVIFDDLDAENPNNSQMNPYHKIVDFVNNVNKTSLNPNLELKGNVYILPDLVLATTNSKELFIEPWMSCPAAIRRRINYKILVTRHGSTQKMLLSQFQEGNQNTAMSHIYGTSATDDYQILETEDTEILFSELRGEFLRHLELQEQFVAKINDKFDERARTFSSSSSGLLKSCWDSIKMRKKLECVKRDIVTNSIRPPRNFDERLYRRFRRNYDYVSNFAFVRSGILIKATTGCFLYDGRIRGTRYTVQEVEMMNHRWFTHEMLDEIFPSGYFARSRSIVAHAGTQIPPTYNRSLYTAYQQNIPQELVHSFAFGPGVVYFRTNNGGPVHHFEWNQSSRLKERGVHLCWWTKEEFEELLNACKTPPSRMSYASSVSTSRIEPEFAEDAPYSAKAKDGKTEEEDTLILVPRTSEEKILEPSYNLTRFQQNPPRNDPLMVEVLATKPEQIKLVLREWTYTNGCGDFVFGFKHGDSYHYIVTEVKASRGDARQMSRSITAFRTLFHRNYKSTLSSIYGCSIVGTRPFYLFHFSGNKVPFVDKHLHGLFGKWFMELTALRCANTLKNVDVNSPC